jgi:hypothetical protein
MASLPATSLPAPDQHQPSFVKLNIGTCPSCPSYSFSSKAEKQRHCRIMHRLTKKDVDKLDCSGAGRANRWVCKWKTDSAAKECGLAFRTNAELQLHKTEASHARTRGAARAAQRAAHAEGIDAAAVDKDANTDDNSNDEGKYDDAEVESFAQSDSGSDILGDDGAGRNHRWVEGVLKGVHYAHTEFDEICRKCDGDVDHEANDIACNMCSFVFHPECLDPPATAQQVSSPFFFLCGHTLCKKDFNNEQ